MCFFSSFYSFYRSNSRSFAPPWNEHFYLTVLLFFIFSFMDWNKRDKHSNTWTCVFLPWRLHALTWPDPLSGLVWRADAPEWHTRRASPVGGAASFCALAVCCCALISRKVADGQLVQQSALTPESLSVKSPPLPPRIWATGLGLTRREGRTRV